MSTSSERFGSRLLMAGAVIAVAGIGVGVAGLLSASTAESNLREAELAVTEASSHVAEAEADLEAADLAKESADQGTRDADTALAAAEADRNRARAVLSTLEDEAPTYVDAAGELLASATETEFAAAQLVEMRRSQIEALDTADYADFNDRRQAYVGPAADVAIQLADFFTQVENLPELALPDPYRYDGPASEAMATREPVPLDPPTGPAVVAMTLPEQVPCVSWGNGGCNYSWKATIEESNWLEVTITRIGVRYRGGGGYCVIGGEWDDVSRVIEANGRTTWSGSLIEDRNGECAPVLGGDLLVRWEGTDAEGNSLSGRATADLAPPP